MCPSPLNPLLPAELERHIFEIEATLRPRSIPTLMLVAQRVKIWIEPLLYRVLSVGSVTCRWPRTTSQRPLDRFLHLLDSRPAAFFHDRVRHVSFLDYYGYDSKDLIKILSVCDRTVDLAMCNVSESSELLPVLSALPLQRLLVHRAKLIAGPSLRAFTHPLFAQITHLKLLDYSQNRDDTWPGLALIPKLTHLAFNDIRVHASVCVRALADCKALEVLVLVCADTTALKIAASSRVKLARDPRFVMLVVEDDCVDWEEGARGGEDMWLKADALVLQRQTGKTAAYFQSPL
ncbi:hypothetical protein B0H19DRAFT_432820 [Mycena capillaripes]|nr:hypothetical protein B0H19DRAFT_432820 [Mycena capillaripes]